MAVKEWDSKGNVVTYRDELFDREDAKLEDNNGASLQPTIQKAHKLFIERLVISLDEQNQIMELGIRHESPMLAKMWVQLIVDSVNESSRVADVAEARGPDYLEKLRSETKWLTSIYFCWVD